MIKQQQAVFMEENMSNLTSQASGDQATSVSSGNTRGEPTNHSSIYQQQQYFSHQNDHLYQDLEQPQQPPAKKKRSLPGNPDPDAEVIALSPKALLATNRFVCEICNKGFQRDQNLQLHRRGHNLPWKLKQRSSKEVKKKVYVCPEPSCVHHDPARALGDLTGIKKHFCRKHGEKKWKCDKCSKRYAVQSDWKAHSKVCGTREYRCDCGTLFSRRDSFITHRAFCDALAEETARAITTNSLLSNPVGVAAGPSSASHFINLQQQQQQLINSQHDSLHPFPQLKREPVVVHQHQQNLMSLPPWLACPPTLVGPSQTPSIDHHHHHQSSSSQSIFHQDHHHQNQMRQPQEVHHQNPSNSNSNPNMGPTVSFGGAYHSQAAAHMSATALLQKAAQMGATMSKPPGSGSATAQPHQNQNQNQNQGHVSDTNPNNTATTTTAGLFGLNLSSRDHPQEIMSSSTTPTGLIVNHGLSSFGNKAATPTPPTTTIGGSDSDQIPSPNQGPPPSSSFLHDMMVNSLSTPYDNHEDAFGIGGMMGNSKKESAGSSNTTTNGVGGNHEGLTRDFLGLRPLSHSDILTIAGLGNCITTNQQQDNTQHKQWQGN